MRRTVWITEDVELPQELLDAYDEGKLVFFIGAGASVAAPSNLPLFKELAQQLGSLAGEAGPSENDILDQYIGQLESLEGGFDAHQKTLEIMSDSESKPNALHKVVMALASGNAAFRVVTTNYDNHLARVAAEKGMSVPDVWCGPALPRGRDFEGLIHLHGSVERSAKEIILTDRDFGIAYITEAWATRFLLAMFDEYTTVFIGYSHDDFIMRYLALGLPSKPKGSKASRFIFTDETDTSKLSTMGLVPIIFPNPDKTYTSQTKALEAWLWYSQLNADTRASRIEEIVSAGMALGSSDQDFLLKQLSTVAGMGDFLSVTRRLSPEQRIDWFEWLSERSSFSESLADSLDIAGLGDVYGQYLEVFICDEETQSEALSILSKQTLISNHSVIRSLAFGIRELGTADRGAAARWRMFLLAVVESAVNIDGVRMLHLSVPQDQEIDLNILRFALRPKHTFRPLWSYSFGSDRGPAQIEITWNASASLLTRLITGSGDSASVLKVLETSLVEAYSLLSNDRPVKSFDKLGAFRSAIETHEQNRRNDPVGAIIDALRELGQKHLSTDSCLPERWWNLGYPLFRRLAVHIVGTDSDRDSDSKIGWMLDREALYAPSLRHEIYKIVAATAPQATATTRERLLEAILAGPDLAEETPNRQSNKDRAIFNLITWVSEAAPDWEEAKQELSAFKIQHPDFHPTSHPDLSFWSESGVSRGTQSSDINELIEKLEKDQDIAIRDLLEQEYSEHSFDGPTYDDLRALISGIAREQPLLAIALWEWEDQHQQFKDIGINPRVEVIRGWAQSESNVAETSLLNKVSRLVNDPEASDAIGYFLLQQIQRSKEDVSQEILAAMRKIAADLWEKQSQGFVCPDVNPLTIAPLYMNSWPGHLTQYWIREISRRLNSESAGETGMTAEEDTALTALINGPTETQPATYPALAEQVFFLFQADEGFAVKHVLPLFANESTAELAWFPYLHSPRIDIRILKRGLLDSMVAQWERLDALGEQELTERFYWLVLSSLSVPGLDTEDRHRLLVASVTTRGGKYATEFARATVRWLRDSNVDGAAIWDLWLGEHLRLRAQGTPRKAQKDEFSAWADLVPYVGSRAPELLALLEQQEIGFDEYFVVPDLHQIIDKTEGAVLISHYCQRLIGRAANASLFDLGELEKALEVAYDANTTKPFRDALKETGHHY